jgi:hypothetical protein
VNPEAEQLIEERLLPAGWYEIALDSPVSPKNFIESSSPLWRVTLARWAPRSSRPGGTIEAIRQP